MLLGMMSAIASISNMLMNVMLQMAALAESGQVYPFVVFAVSVEVGYREHYPGESVEAEPGPFHFSGILFFY